MLFVDIFHKIVNRQPLNAKSSGFLLLIAKIVKRKICHCQAQAKDKEKQNTCTYNDIYPHEIIIHQNFVLCKFYEVEIKIVSPS